jgi:cytosine/adenosine deaminase-related metal-dependent hydrolase
MESFSRYLDRGVGMTLGTDTCPQSMLDGMRWTAVASKWVDRRAETATAADVFTAATLGGAAALGRDDLGRLAAGAKADLLIWDGQSITMAPLRGPVKNLIYSAQTDDLRDVVIDGEFRMRNRTIPGVDTLALARDLQAAAERMWGRMSAVDHAGRTVDQLSPQSFPAWEG